jgi:hypothetical protein
LLHWQFALDQFSYREAVIQNSPMSAQGMGLWTNDVERQQEMWVMVGLKARAIP